MAQGFYYEDLTPGRLFRHAITRTVTEMDNVLFSAMTHNPQPLHIDRHYCRDRSEFGQPLVNSFFTLGLTVGIAVNDTTLGTTIANLGIEEARFPHPLFHGDTVRVETEVKAQRLSRSRSHAGLVEFEHRAYNQDDVLVAICRRTAFMHCRPAAEA